MCPLPGGGEPAGRTPPENYELYFVPAIGEPLARDLIDAADLCPGERILDVACGTGVVARMAARKVGNAGSVAGLDLNPGMLAVARAVSDPELGITWHEASAESLPFADASFDVVVCQMGLQFVPDRSAAMREMYRVLRPGGRLVLNLPGPTPQPMGILEAALASHIAPEAAGFVGVVFSLHDIPEIRSLVESAGFGDVSVEAETRLLPLPAPREFLWQYVMSTPLAGTLPGVDEERRAAFEREVVGKWEDFVEKDAMRLEIRMVTVTAHP